MTRKERITDEVWRWAVVVLLVLVVALGYYVHRSEIASNRAAAASDRAAEASDRAASAALKASSDLSAAITASNDASQAAAVTRALTQIDLVTTILCADHPTLCPTPTTQPGG